MTLLSAAQQADSKVGYIQLNRLRPNHFWESEALLKASGVEQGAYSHAMKTAERRLRGLIAAPACQSCEVSKYSPVGCKQHSSAGVANDTFLPAGPHHIAKTCLLCNLEFFVI